MKDHERGCQGREYTCKCGYDDEVGILQDAAREWRSARSGMVNMPMSDPAWREALNRLSSAEDNLSRVVLMQNSC